MLGSRIIPEARRREFGRPPRTLERSPGHHQEWINACKGGKPAGSNFPDHAGLLAQVVLLGNVALRASIKEKLIGTKLLWDGRPSEFTNLPEANAVSHQGIPARAGRSDLRMRRRTHRLGPTIASTSRLGASLARAVETRLLVFRH